MAPFVLHPDSKLQRDLSLYPEGIVIPIDKPYRWGSTDVVQKLKYHLSRYFNTKNLKIGHAGTLDPLATGLLLVCVGKATKIAEKLQNEPKEYIAQFTLGATTPSYDREHPIDEVFKTSHITLSLVQEQVQKLCGEQEQVPPLFSAKLIDGVRSYIYARHGEVKELKANKISIYRAELLNFFKEGVENQLDILPMPYCSADGSNTFVVKKREGKTERDLPIGQNPIFITQDSLLTPEQIAKLPVVELKIACSKGTYIRSCARDFGLALGSGAFMSYLQRTKSGGFSIEDANSFTSVIERCADTKA